MTLRRNDPPGILVIDDNELVGESLSRWAALHTADIRWLRWTSDEAAALAVAADHLPDVVLLDVDMPGVDTFALIGRLRAAIPDLTIVMLSGHVRAEYIDRCADAGAHGYIVKDEDPQSILSLARRAAAGEFVLSPTARTLVRRPDPLLGAN